MIEKMELCTARGISSLPLPLPPNHFSRSLIQFQSLRCTSHFALLHNQTRFCSGLLCHSNSSLRSTRSDEISTDTTGTTAYVKDEPKSDGLITAEETQPVEKKEDYGSQLNEQPQEGSLIDNPLQLFKFLEDLNIKLDYEETYPILVFGGGGAVALWLVAAVIGAVDSIPVLPKVLELVGLGYTLWFTSRYLILKKNRDELFARVEQIKQQILGLEDD